MPRLANIGDLDWNFPNSSEKNFTANLDKEEFAEERAIKSIQEPPVVTYQGSVQLNMVLCLDTPIRQDSLEEMGYYYSTGLFEDGYAPDDPSSDEMDPKLTESQLRLDGSIRYIISQLATLIPCDDLSYRVDSTQPARILLTVWNFKGQIEDSPSGYLHSLVAELSSQIKQSC
jgi:hypothetical protein